MYPFGTNATPCPDTITVTTTVQVSTTTHYATQLPPQPREGASNTTGYMIIHDLNSSGWGLPWVLTLDVPEAGQAGEAEEASEADEAHVPFHGNWTEIRKMCLDLCEEGHAEEVPVYRSEETSGEGSTETVIYCENCNAYGRVTNITSSDGSSDDAFLYFFKKKRRASQLRSPLSPFEQK